MRNRNGIGCGNWLCIAGIFFGSWLLFATESTPGALGPYASIGILIIVVSLIMLALGVKAR